MENEITVVSLKRSFRKAERGIEDAARFFLDTMDEQSVLLSVYLVDNRKMKMLNKKYRGKNSSTNVLAFEYPGEFPDTGDQKSLGEVYLCPPYIKKHNEDMDYMLLHGILHLLGFNHENKSDRIKMEKIEEELIKQWLNNKS